MQLKTTKALMAIPGRKLNKTLLLATIEQNHGIVTHVAKAMDCEISTVYDWISRDDDIRSAVERGRDAYEILRQDKDMILKQKAYSSIEQLLDKQDVTATIFTLKAKAGWQQDRVDVAFKINIIDKPYQD